MEAAWELKPKIEAVLIAAGCEASLEALAKCLEVSVDKAEEAVREFELDLLGGDRPSGQEIAAHLSNKSNPAAQLQKAENVCPAN